MITGSDNGTGHIIEEVVLDFVFDSSVITDEHESLMSTWVVDKLLPTVEAALDEYDEKGKVLRIERITIDRKEEKRKQTTRKWLMLKIKEIHLLIHF